MIWALGSFTRRGRVRRSVLMFVVAVAACGGSTGPRTPAYVGTWSLLTVDGAPLPDTVAQIAGSGTFFLMDGATLLLQDGSAPDSLVARYNISSSATIIVNVDSVAVLGNGTQLEWLQHSDSTDPMTLHGNTLLLTTTRLAAGSHVFQFGRTVP